MIKRKVLYTIVSIAQQSLIRQLRKELGASEETEQLLDWLLDAWETLEILKDRFGEARALEIFTAYAPRQQTRTLEGVMA
jgi:2-keto-3-deoxy-galactonokinase